ncbi:MAG: aminotransferase class I/II [Acidobacteria bacterium RIFCSPLOWO2_12_FULL_67_14]|nr:MAG: aminotransferase class I/II [Acidobacteria bacterium RIFCSPLOWO2_02_FULL_67_21]OFW40256.1 MAG: aminotransferase class I/II [Acidobacteria bacterium RIFCSPLOWO2_12_FULL_67_14]
MPTHSRIERPIAVAARVGRFSYAIRNIVTEARAVEAQGRRVRYLNIGDPVAFGFRTPPHLIEAVYRAMQDGHNGYLPSDGIPAAREAVAADYAARGVAVSPDRVLITTGTSEGIDLVLNALVDEGDEVLVPSPTYPLYTAVLATINARPRFYRTDPDRGWLPDLDHLRSLVTSRTRVLVVIDPNNPTGAVYPTPVRRALIDFAEEHGLTILADEVYAETGFDGPVPLLATLEPDAPIISLSSLSKAYLAPGWRTGWMVAGPTPRLDNAVAAMRKLADGRLCSPAPMQYAVIAALTGDRSHQTAFRRALAERARITTERLNAIPGMRCVAPRAAFYAMPALSLPPGRTDEDFVLSLLRATGILCVYGSGFGMRPEQGTFRIVFLADPGELESIYRDLAAFTLDYLRR